MICIKCRREAPAELQMPNFCVYCAYPMAQPSPYLAGGDDQYIPLRDADNRSLTVCPLQGGLLKACRTCGRLTKIDQPTCLTLDCPGPLEEAAEPFSSMEGSLDGAHTARWPAPMPHRLIVRSAVGVEPLQQLVYRYGLLIGVSEASISLYRPNGQSWSRSGYLRFEQKVKAKSLIVDDGKAFIAGATGTFVIALNGYSSLEQEDRSTDACPWQAKSGLHWIRFVRGQAGSVHLMVRDAADGTNRNRDRAFNLPIDTGSINAVALGRLAVIATNDGLYAVDPATGKHLRLPPTAGRWMRVAVRGELVVALGYKDGGKVALFAGKLNGEQVGLRDLDDNYLTDFAWVDDTIYIPGRTEFATLKLSHFTAQIESKPLQAGLQTQPGMLAMVGKANDVRLLLRRRERSLHRVALLDPLTCAEVPIGTVYASEPLICLADNRIVVGSLEGAGMQIRTHTAMEGS